MQNSQTRLVVYSILLFVAVLSVDTLPTPTGSLGNVVRIVTYLILGVFLFLVGRAIGAAIKDFAKEQGKGK